MNTTEETKPNLARIFRTENFRAKNERRRAARGTPFSSRRARAARRKLNGAFGTESEAVQNACKFGREQ